MRKFLLGSLCLISAHHLSAQTSSDPRLDYISKYKNVAMEEMRRTGVPASITLAQGILESNSGNSRLATYSNNHFGIKCKETWTGDKVYQDDDTKNECFRVYKNAIASFHDHSDFLKNRPYYTNLFTLDPSDYKAWAKGLKKDGYATERDYAKNLIGLIERYDLNQYSELALNNSYTLPATNDDIPQVYYANNQVQNNDVATYTAANNKNRKQKNRESQYNKTNISNWNSTQNDLSQTNKTNNNTAIEASSYPTGLFELNHTKAIFAPIGTSLFALAYNNHVSYEKILKFNDLDKTDILNENRIIFLEKKPTKGINATHIVQDGENLDLIAEKEVIQKKSILEYNQLTNNQTIASGSTLYLHDKAQQLSNTVVER